MNHYLQTIVNKVMQAEQSPRRLAASCSLGIFFAMSPFLGIQTFLAIGAGMLMRLNVTIATIMLYLINNPFTMVPIIIIDYLIGYFLISYIAGYNIQYAVPTFLSKVDSFIQKRLDSWFPRLQFSFAYYFIGGLLLAFVCAIISYPILYRWFKKLKKKKN